MDETVEAVLRASCTVAVVGLGNVPDKPIYEVAQYLLDEGISIVPVHPRAERVFEQPAYRTVAALPDELRADTALLAVRAEVAGEVLEEIVADGRIRNVWLQPGCEPAAEVMQRVRDAGLRLVAGRCMMAELQRRLEG